jgi:uncharacterized protein (TIGR03435 family)
VGAQPYALVVALSLVAAQQTAPSRPSFEVASIKHSERLDEGGGTRWMPGGVLHVTNLAARSLVMTAYGTRRRSLLPSQIIGAPGFAVTERYDITAKLEKDLAAGPNTEWFEKLPVLLQSLLEERFKLKVHREMRELPVYVVRLANQDGRLGPRLRPSSVDCEKERGKCFLRYETGHETGVSVDADAIVQAGTGSLARVVINRTGLTGKYDFDLEWSPDQTSTDTPSLFAAMREQLGLKIDSERAAVDVVVIDHIEHPTED